MGHKSDCAVHNEPAYPAGSCSCNACQYIKDLERYLLMLIKFTEDAPDLDFNEDKTTMWRIMTTQNARQLLDSANTGKGE